MQIELTSRQRNDQAEFREFVQEEILPRANEYDKRESTPPELLEKMGQKGYLGALIPGEQGGLGMDMITYGLLNEEIGRGCSSVRSLLTVHSMVCYALLRWGSKQQRASWIPRLAKGEIMGAFGLSEPNAGSDAKSIETSAQLCNDSFILNGHKKWITYGQVADVFLIFAQLDGKISAFLVEKNTPGLSVEPLRGILGTRASMLAEVFMHDCRIPAENLLGGKGFGLAAVATSTLDIGRYSVAWGCVGLIQACLDASLEYTCERKQFGSYLKDFQLVQQMIANMITDVKAARLLCLNAGYLKDTGSPNTIMETWIAKYFSSTAAANAANNAVQIYGANGCSDTYSVQRYLRDSKVMEIIEGSTQIQQITIAEYGYQESFAQRNEERTM